MIESLCIDALPVDSAGRIIRVHIENAMCWLEWNAGAKASQSLHAAKSVQGKTQLLPSRVECVPGWVLVKDISVDGIGRFSVFHTGVDMSGGLLLIRILFVNGARLEFNAEFSGRECSLPIVPAPTFRIINPSGTSMERSWRMPVGCEDHANAALQFVEWLSIDDKCRDEKVASTQLAQELAQTEQHLIKIIRFKHFGENPAAYEQNGRDMSSLVEAEMGTLLNGCIMKPSAAAVAQEALERSSTTLRSIEDALKLAT